MRGQAGARSLAALLRRIANGQIDPASLLYADRLIPLEPAPRYSEGMVSIIPVMIAPKGFPPSYLGSKTAVYPFPDNVLMVEESTLDRHNRARKVPPSWFWNIRIGDKLRFAGTWARCTRWWCR